MRESIWGYAVISLGVIIIMVIWFMANVTRTDQHNYNLLEETTKAAMLDSLDLSVYAKTGDVQIIEEKFVENFIRRFANNADLSNEYKIEIVDVVTKPPKVSVRVSSKKSTSTQGELYTFNIANSIDAILETKY